MSYQALIQGLYLDTVNGNSDKPLTEDELTNFKDPITDFNNENKATRLFSTTDFINNIKKNSAEKNKDYYDNSVNISAYDIAHQCIRSSIFRINNYPVQSYANAWLPVGFRAAMGTACHDFLQSEAGDAFTENEVCLKIPSRRFSGRLDCLIGNNVLVEIKSCAYSDYSKIISSGQPRPHDYFQTLLYKYCLENHLEELKQQKPTRNGTIPLLDHYEIEYIQLIYMCHELVAADSPSLSEAKKFATNLKKQLESKKNPFWFITTVTIDLKQQIEDTNNKINIINEKWNQLNYHLSTNTIPPMTDKFIDKNSCFFCLFKQTCSKIP